MSQNINVAVIVGSLRKDSVNRKASLALAEVAPPDLKLRTVGIGTIPLYNQDAKVDRVPEPWTLFRGQMRVAMLCCSSRQIQPFGAGLAEECDRCRLPPRWQQRVVRKARRKPPDCAQ